MPSKFSLLIVYNQVDLSRNIMTLLLMDIGKLSKWFHF